MSTGSAGPTQPVDDPVIVVGAGPGGTTLAFLLARSGIDVRLLERQRDLDRAYRGFLFQPLALRTFDQMGVLESILALDHHAVRTPTVNVFGRTFPVFDLSKYDDEYEHAILMEQPPLLRQLIDHASEYEGFEYRPATTVTDLLVEDGRVVGVAGTDREASESFELRSRLVVGADGRYSTVRDAAGIDPGMMESNIEIVWFKLPDVAVTSQDLARFNDGGVLAYFGIGGGESQLGHFVQKGEYTDLRSAGIDAFYDRVIGVDPSLDGVLQTHVTDFSDTTRLHIAPGLSDRWIDNGILLLGDAAHVASPIGAQGNGLAIADAVVAHSVICDALPGTNGVVSRRMLAEYEHIRRPTVERILRYQRRGEWVIAAFVRRRNPIPAGIRAPLIRGLVTLAIRSPASTRLGNQFAWGSWEPVDSSHFVDTDEA